MSRLALIAVLVLAIAACSKNADDKAGTAKAGTAKAGTAKAEEPAGGDCDRLGLKSSVQSMERTPPGTSDAHRKLLQAASDEAGAAIARHCKADAWSAEAIACGLAAKDPGMECGSKLTAEQMKKMVDEVGPIFDKAMAAMQANAPVADPEPAPLQ